MTMAPITLAPQSDVAPHAYVVLRHRQHCDKCDTDHEYSELHSRTYIKSRFEMRQIVNFRPVTKLSDVQYNLPIQVIVRPPTSIPFCHECVTGVDLSHLPNPPAIDAKKLLGPGRDDVSDTPASRAGAKQPRKPLTVDDLLV